MMEIETEMEKRLLRSLTQETSQWSDCSGKIHNEEEIYENIREILNDHNQDKLNGHPLNDREFLEVKNQLKFSSFYAAAQFLKGENGVCYVQIHRDNAPINLFLFDRAQKAGGKTVYQVINQCYAKTSNDEDRRFDVLLLINGLPLVQIELKNALHAGYIEGFNQIQSYIREGVYSNSIFSMIQMFVVSNEVDTRYFAASKKPNKQFLMRWSLDDKDKTPVGNLFSFAKEVLRIPQIHEMVTDYSMLDAEKQEIILLRPYQIHAIQALRKASKEGTSGYIWHTTGSGKTLTSYQAARNLLMDIPTIDKSVFVIDRKDLDQKTSMDFEAYAKNDFVDVESTADTQKLKERLLSQERTIVVTTQQKLQHLIRQYDDAKKPGDRLFKEKEQLRSKRVVFVVDECHRAVTKATWSSFSSFFRRPLWYGFTGTPIFDENKGNLDATTEELYGKRLHEYTLKDALRDKAVLEFQVEYFDEKGASDDADNGFYDTEQHRLCVVKKILESCGAKFGVENLMGHSYSAILTTGSIKKAQQYYDLFKAVKEGKYPGISVPKSITDKIPGFPHVAITYSTVENKEDSDENSSCLASDIADYNALFGTRFTEPDGYNQDINARLARKEAKYAKLNPNERLDLVIVADRLLTGFDAPCLSTVFLDRPPQTPHNLIQTFSRTNRLFDNNKKAGYIMTFRQSEAYREAVKQAVELFSDGGSGEVLSPSWEEADKELRETVASLLASVDAHGKLLQEDEKGKRAFLGLFQRFDQAYARAKGYLEWHDQGKSLEDYGMSEELFTALKGLYNNLIEEFRDEKGDPEEDPTGDGESPEDPDGIDPNYELISVAKDYINVEFILNLIGSYVEGVTSYEEKRKEEEKQKIGEYIGRLSKENLKVGSILGELWESILARPEDYGPSFDLAEEFEKLREEAKRKRIKEFSEEYAVKIDDVLALAESWKEGVEANEQIDYNNMVQHRNFAAYKAKHPGSAVNVEFKYKTLLKNKVAELINTEIIPLRKNL